MRKFKLIKEYPGSPKLGREIVQSKYTEDLYYTERFNNFPIKNPQNYPEFWEEVVEKYYEILSFTCNNKKLYYNKNLKSFNYANNDCNTHRTLEFMLKNSNTYKIHSVKRLSDGEIFTIGDKIDFSKNKNNHYIKSIEINNIGVVLRADNSEWSNYLNLVDKIKQPLFTTEDNVDIFEENESYYVNIQKNSNYEIYHNEPFSERKVAKRLINNNIGKYFSTKEAAEKYILMNKPCLSLNDINNMKTKGKVSAFFMEDLEKLVQQKLNK